MVANGDMVTGQGRCGRHRACRVQSPLQRLAVVLVLLALLCAPPRAMAADAVDIAAVVGFSDTFRPGHWTPLTVTVTNRGSDLSGELEVQVTADDVLRGRPLVTSHRRDLELQRDSRKSLQFTVLPQGLSHPLVIRVRSGGRELAQAEVDLRTRFASERLLLVLSRNADLDLLNDSSVDGLRVLYPHPELLPVHWRGYDAVAAIVLRGVSLERLSTRQFDALHKWIAQGGILAVSGGADYALLRSPRLGALLPATPLGMKRMDAAALQRAFSSSLDVSRPVHVNRLGALRGRVRLRADDTALIVERALGLGRVLYLAFDVAGYPFDRWEGMRGLWLDSLRLPPSTMVPPAVAESGFQSPLAALIRAEATYFPAYSTAFLFLILYLGVLLASCAIPVRGTRRWWLASVSRWAVPVLFAPAAWLLFGPAAFPRGATAAAVALIEPFPDSGYARLGLELGVYSNRSGALRLEYHGAEPVLYPPRQAQREGKAEDWVFDEGPRPFIETSDRRRYVLHALPGEDVIAFRLDASVHDETMGPRLVLDNASGRTLEDAWLVFDGYAYEIGSIAAGARVERKLTRRTHGVEVGKTSWWQALRPSAGASAQMLAPAQIMLERRSKAMGENGYPGAGHALLIGYTASPLQSAGASAGWPRREGALVAFRVAAIPGDASANKTGTEPVERGDGELPEPPQLRGRAGDGAAQ
jgi:hypothetical protein